MKEWLKSNVLIVLMGLQFLVGVTLWASSLANSTSSNAAAMVSINARLDNIDRKLENVPVMAEQLKSDHEAILEARGGAVSMDGRLRAIENNVAVVHAEATDPRRH